MQHFCVPETWSSMSSTITRSEVQAVSRAACTPIKSKDKKKPELQRSSSIEKILRFNSYICSQNYYILPSLLAWLKTSQTVLQSTTEKTIFFIKSLLMTSVMYKLLTETVRKHITEKVQKKDASELLRAVLVVLSNLLKSVYKNIERRVLSLAVYVSLALIFGQLVLCTYLLCLVFVPAGLVFLLVCLYSICHMQYKLNFSYVQRAELKKKASVKKITRPSRPKKPILGDRTISNFNLFWTIHLILWCVAVRFELCYVDA